MTFNQWLEQKKNLCIKADYILNYVKHYYTEYKIYCENNNIKAQKIKEIE